MVPVSSYHMTVLEIGSLVSLVNRGIIHHFDLLTKDLEESGGPYICDKDYTFAYVSMVTIFERVECARWWTESTKTQYWDAIQQREGYQASTSDMEIIACHLCFCCPL